MCVVIRERAHSLFVCGADTLRLMYRCVICAEQPRGILSSNSRCVCVCVCVCVSEIKPPGNIEDSRQPPAAESRCVCVCVVALWSQGAPGPRLLQTFINRAD